MLPSLLSDLLTTGPSLLLHAGAEGHGHVNIWLLVALGIIGNTIYYSIAGPGMIAARALRRALAAATKADVEIEELRLPLRGSALTFEGVRVAGPDGFASRPLLTIGSGTAPITARALLDDPIDLSRLTLRDVEIHLGSGEGRSNVQAVCASLREIPNAAPEAAGDEGRRVRADEVRVSGITVRLAGEVASDASGETRPGADPVALADLRIGPLPDAPDRGVDLTRLVAFIVNELLEAASVARANPSMKKPS